MTDVTIPDEAVVTAAAAIEAEMKKYPITARHPWEPAPLDASMRDIARAALQAAAPAMLAAERERIAQALERAQGNYPADIFRADSSVKDAIAGTAMRHAYGIAAQIAREVDR